MTELDEAAIRARLEAATEGPWFVEPCGDFGAKTALIPDVLRERYGVNGLNCGEDFATAEFIAHARTDIGLLLTALNEARSQVERLHFDLDREAHARQAAEAKVEQWRERMWATVNERAVWRHDLGDHAGELPFMPCPSCERDVHAARAEAAESALAAVRAMDPARILSVPSEEAMLDFLTALNVSGLHPEVPCSVGIGMPFLAGLTEPDADHVHITVTDADSGVVHCCECSHPGERPDQWDPNSWAPRYPVLALVTEWPDMERVADETYIEPWWAPALATPTTPAAPATAPCGCDCRTVPPSGGHDFIDHDGCALVASSVATVCVRCEQWAGESDANCPGKSGRAVATPTTTEETQP